MNNFGFPTSFGSSRNRRKKQQQKNNNSPNSRLQSTNPNNDNLNNTLNFGPSVPLHLQRKRSYKQRNNIVGNSQEKETIKETIKEAIKEKEKEKKKEEEKEKGKENTETKKLGDNITNEQNKTKKESNENQEEKEHLFPISSDLMLKGHTRTISAIGIDRAGSRLLTGSRDYSVKFWDFAAMDRRNVVSFRSLQPAENQQIFSIEFSQNGDIFLLATGSEAPLLFHRDGVFLKEFKKGYKYLSDITQTMGHIAPLSGVKWHPRIKRNFLTWSYDSTARIWDAEDKTSQISLLRHRDRRGRKIGVSSLDMKSDGKLIATGCLNGVIYLWDNKAPFRKATRKITDAHVDKESGSNHIIISDLKFAKSKQLLLSRATDNTIKIWDLRKTSKPLKVLDDLLLDSDQMEVLFSPDEKYIVTGTSIETYVCEENNDRVESRKQISKFKQNSERGTGNLMFFNSTTFELERQYPVCNESLTRIKWHPKINQIIVGAKDSNVHVLYDPKISKKGALLTVNNKVKKQKTESGVGQDVYRPQDLDNVKGMKTKRRRRRRGYVEPTKRFEPKAPIYGKGHSGMLGDNVTKRVMKKFVKNEALDNDPRNAFLKHHDVDSKPYFFKVLKKNQPNSIFYNPPKDDSDDEK
ncbi:gastrulation defective protein [Anaeramoeba flamelloides]|uniref:Gastrulation defective protein n=1 Tax=Anaeramoeba flamelloides TaxID=1746091 RepID=A0ABQ8XJ80_9EUKA|nr:gastrulation defective protein [Anaeramoeba flamelloides]